MEVKTLIKTSLLHARGMTDKILDELASPEDWLHRASPGGNHALWIAGHLQLVDLRALTFIGVETQQDLKQQAIQFGRGSVPQDSIAPSTEPALLREQLKTSRSRLLEALDSLTNEDFDKPASPEAPPFMPTVGMVFQMVLWHEAMHSGQLTIIHRQLGHPPVAGRPA